MMMDYPEDLLIYVKKPSRYLGREPFFPLKDWDKASLRVCLGYPDLYEVGRSHLGINILAGIINSQESYLCDLVFAVLPDMEIELKKGNLPLLSLNYRRPLKDFEVLGLTYAYELLTTNILQILNLAGIPFKASERSSEYPIILGGGPCCGNPEPVAEIFDALIIGDGEEAILEILKAIEIWKSSFSKKEELYETFLKIEGVYVPLYKNKVKKRTYITQKKFTPLYSIPIIPLSHDRVSIEISRGCTRSCRFCEAGFYYRPVREKSPLEILEEIKTAFNLTGYREASLMSLSAGDYTCLEDLVSLLKREFYSASLREYIFTLPSLRIGSLTPKVLEFLKMGRTSTITLAVEAASERLRRVINKNLTLEALFRDIELAKNYGFRRIKLYFMLGLPTEREEDLEELIKLYKNLKKTFKEVDISFSASIFIPKPHTPFQWERQISVDEAYEKIRFIKKSLKDHFKTHNPKQSLLEGVLARGGRELFSLLIEVYGKGARLDSWSDYFNFQIWVKSSERLKFNLEDYLKERSLEEALPWDHIDLGVKKDFLIEERKKAFRGEYTFDCRFEKCVRCGVCQGKIKNYLSKDKANNIEISNSYESVEIFGEEQEIWYEVYYNKKGPSKFLSQLEVLRLFEMVLRREGFKLSYTKGFNPRPKFICGEAVAVGIEVEKEFLGIAFREALPEDSLRGLKIYLGLEIVEAIRRGENKPSLPEREEFYLLFPKKPLNPEEILIKTSSEVILAIEDKNQIRVKPKSKGFSILKFLKKLLEIENPLEFFKILKIYN
ncbi:MAG: TIGR03936 family radical SAM-associated protein [Caldimicrobium sp.]